MKNLLFMLIAMVIFYQFTNAQSPQSIPFQAVVRDTNGVLNPNKSISVRVSIHDSVATGTVVYKETQAVTTNNLGLMNLNIGLGTVVTGTFAGIKWGSGAKFVQIEADPTGGSSYVDMGAAQLQSVPYALFALNSGGGSTQPATQIPYAGSKGQPVSDPNFTRDSLTQVTYIICSDGVNFLSALSVDSENAQLMLLDPNAGYANILSAGHNREYGFGANTVVAATLDGTNNIMHGFYAMRDSTEMITTALGGDGDFSNSSYYGLAGTRAYSAYFDILYNNGTSLNSLTVDSDGMHWEYGNVNRYSFPNTDGQAGQVLGTDGSGHLSWTNSIAGKGIFTPASGDNITAVTGTNIIKPASGIAALTITLPSSPGDNQTLYFTFTNTITAITFSGGTVSGPLGGVSSVSGGNVKYWLTYDAGSSTWY